MLKSIMTALSGAVTCFAGLYAILLVTGAENPASLLSGFLLGLFLMCLGGAVADSYTREAWCIYVSSKGCRGNGKASRN